MSHGLKKNLFFQDQRLPAMITQYIKNHKNNTTTFASEIDKFIIWDNILNENNIHIYRIVQKAVYNAYKYAFAKNCQVYLQ